MIKTHKGENLMNQALAVRKGGTGHRGRRILPRVGVLALVVCCGSVYAGSTERVSVDSAGAEANDLSIRPIVSANGRFVAFDSLASNLVADDTKQGRGSDQL